MPITDSDMPIGAAAGLSWPLPEGLDDEGRAGHGRVRRTAPRTREDRPGTAPLPASQRPRQTPPRRHHRRPQLQGPPRAGPIPRAPPRLRAVDPGRPRPFSSPARRGRESPISPVRSATRPAASASPPAPTASPGSSTSSPSPVGTVPIPSSSSGSQGRGCSSSMTGASLRSQARGGTTSSKSLTTAMPAVARCSPARSPSSTGTMSSAIPLSATPSSTLNPDPQRPYGPPLLHGDRHGLESAIGLPESVVGIVGMRRSKRPQPMPTVEYALDATRSRVI